MISVIICTRDRCDQLAEVLTSATKMIVPDDLCWEMVIVDNGSSDNTPDVIASFSNRLPIRRVFEPKPGLSNARNCGVSEARGSYICWTDDDVRLDPRWIASYANAFTSHPEAAVFCGPIEPVLLGSTPAWFSANRSQLGRLLAERDLGPVSIPIDGTDGLIPYGANFAVRAAEQRLYKFDPNLGVGPGQRRLGEETSVLREIFGKGATGWWVPSAGVRHLIPEARQTLDYVRQYERSSGETWAYLSLRTSQEAQVAGLNGPRFSGVHYWLWRRYFTLRLLASRPGKPTSGKKLSIEMELAYTRGAIEYMKRSVDL